MKLSLHEFSFVKATAPFLIMKKRMITRIVTVVMVGIITMAAETGSAGQDISCSRHQLFFDLTHAM